ncbi:hypothetical protein BT96DRAFT_996174 [Gymnopus androsaceus JB14]|uniref:Uncharacterized protein n=1 Tax=Gymnopus androsaceus JB14 TaxID=1447944 RepID=A0A6A4HHA5_9AGAR|nr:hypothetical protein BT96DRAFT_996174 [Gymnopus androsaceus JB14]
MLPSLQNMYVAFVPHDEELPDIPATISERYRKRKEYSQDTSDPEEDYMTKCRKLSTHFDNLILKAKASGKGAKGKPSIARLAVKYVSTIDNSSHFGCAAEKCLWLQDGNAAEDRILRHTAECKHLSLEDKNYTVSLQAGGALGARVTHTAAGPAAKATGSTTATSTTTASAPEMKLGSIFVDFTKAGKTELQEKLDHCIMKLICVCGLVPNILDSDEWQEFMTVANPKYKVTSSSTFRNKHIPREAALVHQQTVKILRNHHNLTFTFDGNNTRGHESVYTGHFTTPDRQTFLFCSYEDTTASHDHVWVKDHIFRALDEVGQERTSNLCSDSTGNTKKGRELAKIEHPILSLEEFRPMIDILKATIRHFSHSDSSTKKVEALRKEEGITKGLVTIGKDSFATHYSAANKDVVETFTGRHKGTLFQLSLAQYIQIIDPLVHSLWALESAKTNAAHVFLFWLAMGAKLKELFERDTAETEIEPDLLSSEYPFSDPVGEKSVLEWWTELGMHPKARTLAYLGKKAYSALANSMVDECTGSRFTRFNSTLRNHQKVSTLVDMTKVGQWYGVHQKSKKQQSTSVHCTTLCTDPSLPTLFNSTRRSSFSSSTTLLCVEHATQMCPLIIAAFAVAFVSPSPPLRMQP